MKIATWSTPLFDARRCLRGRRLPMALVVLAAACFAGSVWGFGAVLPGYSQLAYSVAILGARGVPHASAFNLLAFVLSGLVMVVVAVDLCRSVDSAGVPARIAGWILLFSTLAFTSLGVFPLHLDGVGSTSGRLHVACWGLWWLTTATGGVLLSLGSRRWPPAWRVASVVLALLVPWWCLFSPATWGSALPERIAFALWFGWWLLAAAQRGRRPTQP